MSESSYGSAKESGSIGESSSSLVQLGDDCAGCAGDTPRYLKLNMPYIEFSGGGGWPARSLTAGEYEVEQHPDAPCCYQMALGDGMYLSARIGATQLEVLWGDSTLCPGGLYFMGATWRLTLSAPPDCINLDASLPNVNHYPGHAPPVYDWNADPTGTSVGMSV
jgi:hypothetical protein